MLVNFKALLRLARKQTYRSGSERCSSL